MRIIFLILSLGGLSPYALAHIHTVKMKSDQILVVKTAIGIATIIEAPETVQSAIIGDQSAFKIEYIDRAVTIKPLRYGAKTNLYLQTPGRRYDLRLETGRQEAADYIVYLKENDGQRPTIWTDVSKSFVHKDLTLKLSKIGNVPQGYLILDLKLTSKSKYKLSPDSIWIKQKDESKTIDGLFLSGLEVSNTHPVMIGLTLLKSDLLKNQGFDISISIGGTDLKLGIGRDVLWR